MRSTQRPELAWNTVQLDITSTGPNWASVDQATSVMQSIVRPAGGAVFIAKVKSLQQTKTALNQISRLLQRLFS